MGKDEGKDESTASDRQDGMSRRAFLQGSGALLGSSLLPVAGTAWAASLLLNFDFRGSLPAGISFRRNSSASVTDDGRVRYVPANTPRFPTLQGAPLGLLIEGAASNLIANASRPDRTGWSRGGGVTIAAAGAEIAPDGSTGVFRISRPQPQSGSVCVASVANPAGAEFGAVSVWLRSPSGTGKWRVRVLDFKSYSNVNGVVEVGPQWRRYSLALYLQPQDTGSKRFDVLWNEPFGPAPAPVIYALNLTNPYEPARTPLTLANVLMWGAQYETAREATSFIPTNGAVASRAADEVSFPAAPLNASSGRLTIVLPDGGQRGGVILDASSAGGGLRLEYSNSGWLVARVGQLVLSGFGDATAERVIQLEWSAAGVQLFTGPALQSLARKAAITNNPLPINCGSLARLGMALNGKQPLNRVLALLTLDSEVSAIGQVVLPALIPALYRQSFGDDFDDPDLTRINENATGGRPGAPAWRSRYRQDRNTVINGEKQIYMDRQFAGTAKAPLQVQPFSIQNGFLRIRAERADPLKISPFIWNYRYTSGCITSELTHCYFEMRARLPRGKGFWPAFWLLPKREFWPPEIDVLEASGTRPYGVRHGAIEKPRTATTVPAIWIDRVVDTSDGFHAYGVEWTRENIVFFIDGRKSFEYGPHAIHEDMYLLANLALGSNDANWIPDPDATTPLPGVLDIDYIRAYQRSA